MIITNLKDIRINQDQGMVLFKRSIISRDMLPRTGNFITINDCSFAFANRINKFADLEVKNNSNWIFVNNNDEDSLRKVFEQSDEITEVEESIELETEVKEIIEPVEDDQTSSEADYVFIAQDEEQSSEIPESITTIAPESEVEEDQDEQLVVITPETETGTNNSESATTFETTTTKPQQYRQIHVGKNKKKHH